MNFEKAQKLEAGDILIALDSTYAGSHMLEKYATIKVSTVELKEEQAHLYPEDNYKFIKLTGDILSGDNKDKSFTVRIGDGEELPVTKRNHEAIQDYYDNVVLPHYDNKIDKLRKEIRDLSDKRYDKRSEQYEAMSVVDIDDHNSTLVLNAMTSFTEAETKEDKKAVVQQVLPKLKEVLA